MGVERGAVSTVRVRVEGRRSLSVFLKLVVFSALLVLFQNDPRMLLTDDAKHGERSMPHLGDYKGLRVKSNFIRLVEFGKENLDGFFALFR